jgi:hypothetical protein
MTEEKAKEEFLKNLKIKKGNIPKEQMEEELLILSNVITKALKGWESKTPDEIKREVAKLKKSVDKIEKNVYEKTTQTAQKPTKNSRTKHK